jgi:hypothetical protein
MIIRIATVQLNMWIAGPPRMTWLPPHPTSRRLPTAWIWGGWKEMPLAKGQRLPEAILPPSSTGIAPFFGVAKLPST